MICRGYPGKATEWPKQLRALVESHGAEAVHRAGLKAFGYPPIWTCTTSEAMKVVKELSQGE